MEDIRTTCRSCNSKNLETIIDFGNQPWCNDFHPINDIYKVNKYPLTLVYCHDCTLLQLNYTVKKEVMFLNHTYVSGTTNTLKQHFYNVVKENIAQFNIQPDDIIMDIGGNDGTKLLQYKSLGMKNTVNVESATNIADISKTNGIKTINTFFNETISMKGYEKNVKLMLASGVFFHLEELHGVIKGIKNSLKDDGIFVVEFMYAKSMIKNVAFDGIYHEHLCYYTLKSLEALMKPYGFVVFDAYESPIHGGSVIAKLCFEHNPLATIKTERYHETVTFENLYMSYENIKGFANKVKAQKEEFMKQIQFYIDKGINIYAFGAPAKGNTLLNYYGLNSSIIKYIFEKNQLKVGLYTPGTNIPIVNENEAERLIPNDSIVLTLAWNFFDEIVNNNSNLLNKGIKFIKPFSTKFEII